MRYGVRTTSKYSSLHLIQADDRNKVRIEKYG